ncbi:hypothetical protein DFR42_1081 [Undibacterium pigrum]|uniref:Uncharacterized protein n=1 Tax=Undibacterium pigrum TaxID=401470 RepID=A0A318J8F3_9BURK|nr:hypothetical protein DFR42_1081 [Undibacterium pigrum]
MLACISLDWDNSIYASFFFHWLIMFFAQKIKIGVGVTIDAMVMAVNSFLILTLFILIFENFQEAEKDQYAEQVVAPRKVRVPSAYEGPGIFDHKYTEQC